jgi:chromosome partitioning protein
VTMIDADPNKPVARWASRPGKPENLTLVDNVTEQTIIRAIDDAARKTAFVIVDLEGTASMMVVYAISRADLVIIPTSASLLDAVEAVSAVQLVQRQEEAFRIKIPSAVLFTKTSAAIRTRTLASIEAELDANDVPIFKSRIHDREAFRSLFSFGGTLSSLDPKQVRNIPAAVDDAQAFASEVVELLKSQRAAVAAVA